MFNLTQVDPTQFQFLMADLNENGSVDVLECTMCILEKETAIPEMVRVVKPRGFVAKHYICWKKDTPKNMKEILLELEGESPETADGWENLFLKSGLDNCRVIDKSGLIPFWTKDHKKQLGIMGQFRIFVKVLRKWGMSGVGSILQTAKIFSNPHTGYAIIVGNKSSL